VDHRRMDFRRLLTMKKNAAMTDQILLPEHAEEKSVFFFIIESTDPFCLFWEGAIKCFHCDLRPCMCSEKVLTVSGKRDNRGKDTAMLSNFLLYSLNDLGDQVLKIELKLDDVGRKGVLKLKIAFVQQNEAENNILHLGL